jgi:hypothetical protein
MRTKTKSNKMRKTNGGEPQKVSSLPSGSNVLLNPKSAILMFKLLSSSKFSAYSEQGNK